MAWEKRAAIGRGWNDLGRERDAARVRARERRRRVRAGPGLSRTRLRGRFLGRRWLVPALPRAPARVRWCLTPPFSAGAMAAAAGPTQLLQVCGQRLDRFIQDAQRKRLAWLREAEEQGLRLLHRCGRWGAGARCAQPRHPCEAWRVLGLAPARSGRGAGGGLAALPRFPWAPRLCGRAWRRREAIPALSAPQQLRGRARADAQDAVAAAAPQEAAVGLPAGRPPGARQEEVGEAVLAGSAAGWRRGERDRSGFHVHNNTR